MKRLIPLLLMMAVVASACGDDTSTTEAAGPGEDPPTTVVPAPSADFDATTLVDDYGCGYGFAKGDATQTVSLVLYSTAPFNDLGPDMTTPVVLPSPEWSATLTTGTDLFANWCDDVMEVDEPVPAVTSEWTLVAGTLTVTSATPITPCGGGNVTATLHGAIAESDDGSRVELSDLTLLNSAWGCFAG